MVYVKRAKKMSKNKSTSDISSTLCLIPSIKSKTETATHFQFTFLWKPDPYVFTSLNPWTKDEN